MFGGLLVHLFCLGNHCFFGAVYCASMCALPPCFSHRHLLLFVCSQNFAKTSTGGHRDGGKGEGEEEEEEEGEKKGETNV